MRVNLGLVAVALLSVACSEPAPVDTRSGAAAAAPADRAAQQTVPPEAAPAAQPIGAEPQPAPAGSAISGTVLERIDSGGYTYLRLQTGNGEQWAAVNQSKVEKGAKVTVVGSVWMEKFESPTLKRKFDVIVFGMLEPSGGAAPASAHGAGPGAGQGAPMAHPTPVPAADVGEIKVEKAAGPEGRTVAEIHAQRVSLKDKPVAVRGKVVKFLPGIMGRNWLHLRDGSGSRDKRDDDLTVTTKDSAAVGDVVLVKGKTAVERDFGAGYKYEVIVEDALLSK